MSKRGRDLTAEETRLWRRVAANVRTRKALPAEPTHETDAPPVTVRKATPTPPRAPVANAKPSSSPPADRGSEKRVRRGKLEIGGTLDLHGHNQITAPAALARFLLSASKRGDRTVIVVTGAGRGGHGVLKQRLPEWLNDRALRPLVAGFAQAHRTHGGAGAYYVFLKRRVD